MKSADNTRPTSLTTKLIIRSAPLLAVAALVSACSGTDAQVYEGYKCSRVAEMLGKRQEAAAAIVRVAPLLEGKRGNANKYMVDLANEFSDDLELHKLSGDKRRQKLEKEFESDDCQRLYL